MLWRWVVRIVALIIWADHAFLTHKDILSQILARSAYRGGSSAQNERRRTMRERPRDMEASRAPHSDPGQGFEVRQVSQVTTNHLSSRLGNLITSRDA